MYERIRNLREDRDLGQQVLASMLNVSQTTYSRYENGILDVPSRALILLADYYQTSIDYLVGRTDEKSPYGKKVK